jgi:hypothetical protein
MGLSRRSLPNCGLPPELFAGVGALWSSSSKIEESLAMTRSAGLPSISVRSSRMHSSCHGAFSTLRRHSNCVRFQQTSNDMIDARAFFEHRFRADLEGLKDCFLVSLLKLGVALDVQARASMNSITALARCFAPSKLTPFSPQYA